MKKIATAAILGLTLAFGVAGAASAGGKHHACGKKWRPCVPEIDVFSGLAALATLGGAGALVVERRRRRPGSEN